MIFTQSISFQTDDEICVCVAKRKHDHKTVKTLRRIQRIDENEEDEDNDDSTDFVMRCGSCDLKWTPNRGHNRRRDNDDVEDDDDVTEIEEV